MNYRALAGEVAKITEKAAENIRKHLRNINNINIETKSHNSFVTIVDKQTEEFLVESLLKILPNSGILAEESGERDRDREFLWIIDPLDGTTNFIHGLSPVAVSIGLMHNGELVLGVVHEVGFDELFWATIDDKAYLNNKVITVSNVNSIHDALLATGFPYYDYERLDQYMNLMREFMHTSHGLRRLGSAATDMAYVACGRFEGFFEYSLNPWDVAAGTVIVRQAGGIVTDFTGGNNFLFGEEIIAANAKIFPELLSFVKRYMEAQ
ncbi:MAG TPA: inositol monophosphatase family protein [Salinivirgaceae bacterium]|nr:inositol monophosphatase family protein [Salinivirgaceae bacterium]